MAVQRKPKKADSNPDSFVDGAPDAKPKGGYRRGKRRQISLTVEDQLLEDMDRLASRYGISRAAAIALACRRLVDQEG